MKDFHDIYSMISSSQLPSFDNLEGVYTLVFEHRETTLALPITYAEDEMKQVQTEKSDNLPIIVVQVIARINDWLRLNT